MRTTIKFNDGLPDEYGKYLFQFKDGTVNVGLYDSYSYPYHNDGTIKTYCLDSKSIEYRNDVLGYANVSLDTL